MQTSEFSGFTVYFLSTVDSTNNYVATPEIQSKLPHKSAIVAEHQSKGKGQLDNKWESASGENLLLSIFIKPDLPIKNQFLLSCVAALAIKDTVSYYIDGRVFIKWPNDIYVNQKKIAGILIENSIYGSKINRSIIGIGLNINQSYFKTGNYNSLKLITEKFHNLNSVLKYLLYRFNTYYKQISNPKNNLKIEFDNFLYAKDEWRSFKTPENQEFQAKIIGTTPEGKIKLRLKSGDIRSYDHKKIFFN
jgi:BirA family biotin operon repressor/biotin-[acetyl-CoA-carboxylase] ligase